MWGSRVQGFRDLRMWGLGIKGFAVGGLGFRVDGFGC